MADTESLIPLAEIAGVFVGFGALIAVRSGGASGAFEVGYMRSMVAFGALTIVAALAPVALARYDVSEHAVWALSSALILVGWVVFFAANVRTPEYRANWATEIDAQRTGSRWLAAVYWSVFVPFLIALFLPPVVIILGLAPELEAALYFTDVVLVLITATATLLGLVYVQRRPAAA